MGMIPAAPFNKDRDSVFFKMHRIIEEQLSVVPVHGIGV